MGLVIVLLGFYVAAVNSSFFFLFFFSRLWNEQLTSAAIEFVKEGSMIMLSELGRRPMIGNNENSFGDEFEDEIGFLLREQRREEADDLEKELNLYRSGSAVPTVDGSLNVVGGSFNHGVAGASACADFAKNGGNRFMSEEELRSDPAYLNYYYLNGNLNPRLPPPLLSRENWRYAQRLQGGSSAIGDRRKVNRDDNSNGGRSMFPSQPGFNLNNQ